jgi:hypothetical protein
MDDALYKFYSPDEIQAAGCEVLKHLADTSTSLSTNLPELQDDWDDEQKMKTIEKVYAELTIPTHPVSIAMQIQKTVPEVSIIEGSDKATVFAVTSVNAGYSLSVHKKNGLTH